MLSNWLMSEKENEVCESVEIREEKSVEENKGRDANATKVRSQLSWLRHRLSGDCRWWSKQWCRRQPGVCTHTRNCTQAEWRRRRRRLIYRKTHKPKKKSRMLLFCCQPCSAVFKPNFCFTWKQKRNSFEWKSRFLGREIWKQKSRPDRKEKQRKQFLTAKPINQLSTHRLGKSIVVHDRLTPKIDQWCRLKSNENTCENSASVCVCANGEWKQWEKMSDKPFASVCRRRHCRSRKSEQPEVWGEQVGKHRPHSVKATNLDTFQKTFKWNLETERKTDAHFQIGH